jgi:hypothetical protein
MRNSYHIIHGIRNNIPILRADETDRFSGDAKPCFAMKKMHIRRLYAKPDSISRTLVNRLAIAQLRPCFPILVARGNRVLQLITIKMRFAVEILLPNLAGLLSNPLHLLPKCCDLVQCPPKAACLQN